MLYEKNLDIALEEMRSLRIFLTNRGIKQVEDLLDEDGYWGEREAMVSMVRSTRRVGEDNLTELIEIMQETGTLDNQGTK